MYSEGNRQTTEVHITRKLNANKQHARETIITSECFFTVKPWLSIYVVTSVFQPNAEQRTKENEPLVFLLQKRGLLLLSTYSQWINFNPNQWQACWSFCFHYCLYNELPVDYELHTVREVLQGGETGGALSSLILTLTQFMEIHE